VSPAQTANPGKRSAGRPKAPREGTAAWLIKYGAKYREIHAFIQGELALRRGTKTAIGKAAKKFGQGFSTVERKYQRWKRWGHPWERRLLELQPAIQQAERVTTEVTKGWERLARDLENVKRRLADAGLSPDEIAQLGGAELPLVSRIADDLIELKRLRSTIRDHR